MRIIQTLNDCWWKIRGRLWDRHNVVKCRYLPSTWCDKDKVLLHAAFQCLLDFVNQEKPWQLYSNDGEIYEVYSDCSKERAEKEVKDWGEIKILLKWWYLRFHEKNPTYYINDNEMLHRLINVRGYLWT